MSSATVLMINGGPRDDGISMMRVVQVDAARCGLGAVSFKAQIIGRGDADLQFGSEYPLERRESPVILVFNNAVGVRRAGAWLRLVARCAPADGSLARCKSPAIRRFSFVADRPSGSAIQACLLAE